MSSQNKSCLVIGMGQGLSLAIAQRFAGEGFSIGAISRSDLRADELRTQLPANVNVSVAGADAADAAALMTAIRKCEGELGPSSVLVYNVAQMLVQPLLQTDLTTFRKSLAVNVEGALMAVQAIAPSMIANGQGTIILTGGGLALYPAPNLGALAAGKAAVRSLALTPAKELAPENVHVATVTVCGMIRPGSFFAPEKIAEVYWQLHEERADSFRDEVIYKQGAGS